MKNRIAFYGGTFDPVHRGHTDVATAVSRLFALDDFVFIPAFQAPHKRHRKPASVFQRFAMLCEATDKFTNMKVSTIEVELPSKPYTIETLGRLKDQFPNSRLFFVIGADSWEEITTWREWERVLTAVDIVVVTRPGHEIEFSHVSKRIRDNIVDLRMTPEYRVEEYERSIFITDAVSNSASSTNIRRLIGEGKDSWKELVDTEVAMHIEKYGLYR
jgi:nicotinate-nucleotide adenylyltransferase